MRNRMYGGVRGRKVSLKLTFLLLDFMRKGNFFNFFAIDNK